MSIIVRSLGLFGIVILLILVVLASGCSSSLVASDSLNTKKPTTAYINLAPMALENAKARLNSESGNC